MSKVANLTIRPLDISDLERGFIETMRSLYPNGSFDPEENLKVFNFFLKNPAFTTYVAITENQVVGTVLTTFRPRFGNKPVIQIEEVAVHKDYRGRGISTALWTHVREINKARIWPPSKAVLTCNENNQSLYQEKWNFYPKEISMRFDFI